MSLKYILCFFLLAYKKAEKRHERCAIAAAATKTAAKSKNDNLTFVITAMSRYSSYRSSG